MKTGERVFILGCGHSTTHPNLMEFLRDEYVIAVSQWALLYDQYPFDFYYMNDNYRWSPPHLRSNIYSFFERDVPTWSKSLGEGTVLNEISFFEEFKKNKKFGKHTYTSIPWTNEFDINRELLVNGTRPTEKQFTDEFYRKIKICSTGYGSITRCAVDLAFYLGFKNCFLLNLDTIPIPSKSYYNDYIESVFPGKNNDVDCINRSGQTKESAPWTDGYRSSVFYPSVWKPRYDVFKKYNMSLKRVVAKETHDYERGFCSYKDTRFTKETVDFYSRRQNFFEKVVFEDLLLGNYESTSDSRISL